MNLDALEFILGALGSFAAMLLLTSSKDPNYMKPEFLKNELKRRVAGLSAISPKGRRFYILGKYRVKHLYIGLAVLASSVAADYHFLLLGVSLPLIIDELGSLISKRLYF